MDIFFDIIGSVISQLQKPTLAFLLGGMMLAAFGSKLAVPEPVYKFVVMVLLLKVGASDLCHSDRDRHCPTGQ